MTNSAASVNNAAPQGRCRGDSDEPTNIREFAAIGYPVFSRCTNARRARKVRPGEHNVLFGAAQSSFVRVCSRR